MAKVSQFISEGKKIPATIWKKVWPMTGSQEFSFLKTSENKDFIVLYFYPKDATPGCTREGHDFTEKKSTFSRYKAIIFGVSRDSLSSHEKFKEKQNYKIDLISDPEETLCKAFGVIKKKNMYGREYLGIERSTFIIHKSGRCLKEWRKVKVNGHAQEVLEALKQLKKQDI